MDFPVEPSLLLDQNPRWRSHLLSRIEADPLVGFAWSVWSGCYYSGASLGFHVEIPLLLIVFFGSTGGRRSLLLGFGLLILCKPNPAIIYYRYYYIFFSLSEIIIAVMIFLSINSLSPIWIAEYWCLICFCSGWLKYSQYCCHETLSGDQLFVSLIGVNTSCWYLSSRWRIKPVELPPIFI